MCSVKHMSNETYVKHTSANVCLTCVKHMFPNSYVKHMWLFLVCSKWQFTSLADWETFLFIVRNNIPELCPYIPYEVMKGRIICCPVCGTLHIKYHLLLFGKNNLRGGSRFPLNKYVWITICFTSNGWR